jgi:hypothetical protein
MNREAGGKKRKSEKGEVKKKIKPCGCYSGVGLVMKQ